jgi:cardiolipin synthase (CMP-forming)
MDPVTDRLLVICGVVVCWRFELLPRWALGVLLMRKPVMIALGRYRLKRGVELRITWPGRLSVAPVMGPCSCDGRLAGLRRCAPLLRAGALR